MLNVFRPFFAAQTPSVEIPYVAAQTSSVELAGATDSAESRPRCLVARTVENLNRDVNVKPLHSHNDYWRYSPLIHALREGAQSVEADIWYFPDNYTQKTETVSTSSSGGPRGFYIGDEGEEEEPVKEEVVTKEVIKEFNNDQIYVGHNQVFLDPESTLDKMYLSKIYDYLKSSNSEFVYADGTKGNDKEPKNGLFYNSPESPMYFWLDFKTDPHQTYQALQKYLQKLIDDDYLAYYDAAAQKFHPGPVIVTITGNIPWDLIEAEQKRYVFVDAPLKDFAASLDGDINIASKLEKYAELAVFASGSLQDLLVGGEKEFQTLARTPSFGEEVNQRLKSIFDLVHTYRLKTRVWGDVTFPESVRNGHLKELYQDGSDLLNVDELWAFI